MQPEPNWAELEASLLHRCLTDLPTMAETFRVFGTYEWSCAAYTWLWKFLSESFASTGEIPEERAIRVALRTEVGRNPAWISVAEVVGQVFAAPVEARPAAVRKMLLARQRRHKTIDIVQRVTDHLARGQDEEAAAIIVEGGQASVAVEAPPVIPLIPRRFEQMPKVDVCPTGLEALDLLIEGNARGDLGLWVGCTGVGKSTSFINLALGGLSHGWKVLFVDTENGKQITPHRFMANFTGIPYTALKSHMLAPEDRYYLDNWMERNHERLAKQLCITYLSPEETTWADFEAAVLKARFDGFTPDLILFDSPDHLFKDPRKERWQNFSQLYYRIVGRLKQWDMAMWATNQATEDARGKIVTTKHGRDSQDKAKACAFFMSINKLPDNPEDDTRRILYISKSRNTKSEFKIDLVTDFSTMRVSAPIPRAVMG